MLMSAVPQIRRSICIQYSIQFKLVRISIFERNTRQIFASLLWAATTLTKTFPGVTTGLVDGLVVSGKLVVSGSTSALCVCVCPMCVCVLCVCVCPMCVQPPDRTGLLYQDPARGCSPQTGQDYSTRTQQGAASPRQDRATLH